MIKISNSQIKNFPSPDIISSHLLSFAEKKSALLLFLNESSHRWPANEKLCFQIKVGLAWNLCDLRTVSFPFPMTTTPECQKTCPSVAMGRFRELWFRQVGRRNWWFRRRFCNRTNVVFPTVTLPTAHSLETFLKQSFSVRMGHCARWRRTLLNSFWCVVNFNVLILANS